MRKQEFYSLAETVERYEARRFGGASGRHVNQRELRSVLELLPRGGKLLDLPVGTGRLSLFLASHGFECHGVDASASMLELCRSRGLSQLSQADVFTTPLPEAAFDSAVSLRFFFHFRDVRPVLDNVFRALRPGGTYVFDTFNRSPRAWLPLLPEQSRVHLHPPEALLAEATAAGFEVVRQVPCYVFSPLAYRFLPLPLVNALDRLELQLPETWLARVFWQLRRPGSSSAGA
jgi:ubiquinone/menaquinone biosynthesis C-methylase UbiE